MTSSHQPSGLGRYLARHRFVPNPGNPTWLDRDTGQQTIRVLHQPGETTLLYCLDQHRCCLYEAVFSPGTPDAVITAVINAALSPPPQTGRDQTWSFQASGARAKESGTRDDA